MTELLDRHYEALAVAPWVKTEVRHTVNLSQARHKSTCTIARQMIRQGCDPSDLVTFVRGKTVCFHATPLGTWAKLRVKESTGGSFMRLVRYDGKASTDSE